MADCFIAEETMALVVLLRAANVGGRNTFRPSVLATELREYGAVNIGAAGTFVVRRPVAQKKLREEILQRLPFQAEVMICDARDLIRLTSADPFSDEPARPDIVRFVSTLSRPQRNAPSLPICLPRDGDWIVKIIAVRGRFLCGVYKRHMRAIGYLNRLEKLFGSPATTRNWNTIAAIVRIAQT
jgi:uncharacterized protein (DUF1697 family)